MLLVKSKNQFKDNIYAEDIDKDKIGPKEISEFLSLAEPGMIVKFFNNDRGGISDFCVINYYEPDQLCLDQVRDGRYIPFALIKRKYVVGQGQTYKLIWAAPKRT